jgi:hypothetical protein
MKQPQLFVMFLTMRVFQLLFNDYTFYLTSSFNLLTINVS